MSELEIYGINGPVITIKGKTDLQMMETVYIGNARLIGEVIGLTEERTTIQCYENTTGVRPGEPVSRTGMAMSATLGPGLLTGMYDGIGRPLKMLEAASGHYIAPGIDVPGIDTNKKWSVEVKMKAGDEIKPGDIYAECDETSAVRHRLIAPPEATGKVTFAAPDGDYTVNDTIIKYETAEGEEKTLTMLRRWPIRKPRPISKRLPITEPLITGQRVIDALFPIAKGGAAAIPGGFGTGKTMLQHQLAKWSDADIIVYVGCGERGNEMTDVLREFPELRDPRTGRSLMERTVLIANTSDMPVAAREASIYTGITIAEYYRDMGYTVAVIADSTSRWAEALREMSGRLEEMPGEEGYPAYLTSRLAQFYERAGKVTCLGSDGREGALSAIGAVSPAGGDISEPVTQATLRIVKVFWGLDSSLAYRRHFPAINWLNSYSLYRERLTGWFSENVSRDWMALTQRCLKTLQTEAELNEIVQLIGADALSPTDRLTLEVARSLREDFLQQDAMSDNDSYSPLEKQSRLLRLIFSFEDKSRRALERGAAIEEIAELPVREKIGRAKALPNDSYAPEFEKIEAELESELEAAIPKA